MWSDKWLLRFHPDKCTVLDIGTHDRDHHEYFLNNVKLQHVESEKDLGVHVDKRLKFDSHISSKTRTPLVKTNGEMQREKCSKISTEKIKQSNLIQLKWCLWPKQNGKCSTPYNEHWMAHVCNTICLVHEDIIARLRWSLTCVSGKGMLMVFTHICHSWWCIWQVWCLKDNQWSLSCVQNVKGWNSHMFNMSRCSLLSDTMFSCTSLYNGCFHDVSIIKHLSSFADQFIHVTCCCLSVLLYT